MNEELNQAVQALTDEDMAELAGGKLSPKAQKIAKIAGIATAGVVGTVGAVAGVTAIVGAAKYGDGAHYFKEWFGGKKPTSKPLYVDSRGVAYSHTEPKKDYSDVD